MNKYKEHERVSTLIAKNIKNSKLTNWENVSILEMLKIDIILNTGMVHIDGRPLQTIKK